MPTVSEKPRRREEEAAYPLEETSAQWASGAW